MISISRTNGLYQLQSQQKLAIDLEKAWNYFSEPENLLELTPKELNFSIASPIDGEIYKGKIITYKVKEFMISFLCVR